jgi:hypothetical protein
MKKTLFSSLCLLITAVLLYGCKGDQGPAGPAGGTDLPTASIQGRVSLFNEYNQLKANVNVAATVSVDGLSITTTTDSLGFYLLPAVPIGVRTITFSKAGYGSVKSLDAGISVNNFPFSNSNLDSLPTYTITRHALSIDTVNDVVRDTIRLSNRGITGQARNIAVFASDRNDVSSDPARHKFVRLFSLASSDSQLVVSMPSSLLNSESGLRPGTTAFLTVHGVSVGQNSSYFDPRTRRNVYTAVTPAAPTLQFIVP